MISTAELKRWVNTLNDNDDVAIDDGGLTLIARGPHNDKFGAAGDPGVPYLEVGGIVCEDEEDGCNDISREINELLLSLVGEPVPTTAKCLQNLMERKQRDGLVKTFKIQVSLALVSVNWTLANDTLQGFRGFFSKA